MCNEERRRSEVKKRKKKGRIGKEWLFLSSELLSEIFFSLIIFVPIPEWFKWSLRRPLLFFPYSLE